MTVHAQKVLPGSDLPRGIILETFAFCHEGAWGRLFDVPCLARSCVWSSISARAIPVTQDAPGQSALSRPALPGSSSQFPGSTVSFKEAVEVTHKPTPVHSEDSVHSKKTIDSDRYIALTKQLEQALWENERLKKQLQERGGDEALKRQNQILEDELNQALRELREVRPIAEEHNKHCSALRTEIITREHCHHAEEHLEPEYAKEVSTGQTIHTTFTAQQASPVPSYSSRGRQPYVSHVSPPPSEHCVKTVDINDPAQRANLVIVSKHDFETVLMQKKKYTTEVEVMEPADDRQSLNCKLEICMFDLDIDNRMMEYLSSIQPEPKVYVEWSFVGLDQRTAPLPAERALFYTNVMYFGPLSSEIKHYLNKVEMPIDLYLVRSSGHPVKVAEGTLDMLQAMEQPNRCFIRSVFLRGKDLPSRYATDRAMATVNCSFILHECCVGDPPFRDQLEVAIGTLYLKNRDGGVVPDHATHIYIEYALLGHCGPDLETDSIPRGEVMKFKHSKKLRVNDENAPHLKAMLEDRDPKLLRFTVCAEPCSLTADTEVETMGHADVNLNEEMIKRGQDLVSSQVPVYSVDGEHLGSLSVTILGIGTLQQIYADGRVKSR
ncbi:uncharacterized protein LOC128997381 [Macrosteles quadrilineatus]|uniref:uncharacterized protein LOC128997381 n=1 Tax=Macrosteles quadrilineatus TaxID=74068 RepID=UPI0023E134D1|nr:uncharacterized protein LOC128997381 [Macrosteles quadrilineatus]